MCISTLSLIRSGFAGLCIVACGAGVQAQTKLSAVAAGCAAPTPQAGHNTYYIDPIRGSMSGDGSKAHPWHTLAEVFDVRNKLIANAPATYLPGYGIIQPNPKAPIQSGDTLYLMSGNHGSPSLQGYFGQTTPTLYGYNNSSFITVAAAPGQTPLVTQLTLMGVNKWLFQGLTFQSLQNVPSNNGQPFSNASASLNDYFLVGISGPNTNVIFDHDQFMSQADTTSWTTYDWISKRVSGLVSVGGSCQTFTNNVFRNIGFAISVQRNTDVLIQHNTIDHFTDDGIDYGSNNLVIDGNSVTNSIQDYDGFHEDGMQGTPYANGAVSNVTITNNVVINQTTPLVSVSNLQGIDAFDGIWQNLDIENNIVVVNSYHGITFYGVTNIKLVNNTVIGSASANGVSTWINVNPSKSGSASQNATVRNNISSFLTINATGAVVDHNMIATMNPSFIKYYQPSAQAPSAVLATSVFQNFNTNSHIYDMRLIKSPAVNGGTLPNAPSTDIRGYLRGRNIDLGAIKYGGPAVTTLE